LPIALEPPTTGDAAWRRGSPAALRERSVSSLVSIERSRSFAADWLAWLLSRVVLDGDVCPPRAAASFPDVLRAGPPRVVPGVPAEAEPRAVAVSVDGRRDV
jgi:hypothetical protein